MRDPERTGAPYRPGTSAATLNDLRWVYKKLMEIEALLRQLQAEQFRLNGRVAEDRAYLGATTKNTNQIITMLLPNAVERQQLRKMYRDLARPSRNRRRTGRNGCSRRCGRPAQDGKE
jgi:hypothetical protein